jgi:diacylglycerol kinase family enzyme
VDLAEVNGRVFVKNVALGLYAEAKRTDFRDAKICTRLDTMPDVVGPGGSDIDMRWTRPGGHEHHPGAVVLVSNTQNRLGHAVGSGTGPRIDNGLLGIVVVSAPSGRGQNGSSPQRPFRAWSAPTFEIDADPPVLAGIDGEALVLDAQLLFSIRPESYQCAPPAKHHAPQPRP